MPERTYADRAHSAARWSAIAIGFSVPIATALDNVLLLLVLLFWLLGGNYRRKLAQIKENPVAMAALLLFSLLIVGGFYGYGDGNDALNYLGKYVDILFIALFIALFQEQQARNWAITAFMVAMGVTLFLSYVIKTGIFPQGGLLQGLPSDPFVFKLHITQNLFMAFFAYALAVNARHAETSRQRITFGLASGLAAYNVLFMVQGRSGYLALAALFVYFCFDWLRWKGLAIALATGLVIVAASYAAHSGLQQRMNLVATEIAAWQPGQGSETSPSAVRMDYYTNSLAIIRDHPVFGVGTGGFEKAYAEKIHNTAMAPSNNPHNQYLLIAAQLGVVGLTVLLCLFLLEWSMARLLPLPLDRALARGALLTIAVGSLFNSLLLDHSEGLFFAWISGVLFAGLPRRKGGDNSKVLAMDR